MKSTSLGEDIPIVIILKAMGIESDQEIVQLVGVSNHSSQDNALMDLFAGSLEEPYTLGVFNQQQVHARHGLLYLSCVVGVGICW